MTRFFTFVLTFLLTFSFVLPALAGEFTLSENGAAKYAIVVSADAPASTQNAAQDLQASLKEITGAEFVIQPAPAERSIFVGESEAAKKAFPGVDFAAFKSDEILIQTDAAGNLLLAGHPQRGVLYAVTSFLEDQLGVRWWTAKDSFFPKKPTLTIGALNVRYAPKIVCRDAYYRGLGEAKFCVHCKCNGWSDPVPAEWGGHYACQFGVHSFYPLIPPKKYFKDHPDWFPEIDGVRCVGLPGWYGTDPETRAFLDSLPKEQIHADGTQLCLTNEEMRKELVKNALEALRKNPNANIISISQNDVQGFCTCEKCRAIDEANESHAGTLITFVNQVAEEIEKEFPNVWVDTIAYQYTRKPPKLVRPRHNVIIRLCSIECSFLQPLDGSEENADFKSDIEGWSRISPQLYVWDYVTNFVNYCIPHPNMNVLADNIRFFEKNRTIGLFEQGDKHTTVGDFVEARAWVIAHLMWNSAQDEKALWKEFFDGFYGPASEPLLKYLEIIHEQAEKTGIHLGCFRHTTKDWLDYETLKKADVEVKRALAAVADDPVLTERVKRALWAYHLNVLMRYNDLLFAARVSRDKFFGPENPREAAEKLFAFAESQDNYAFRESGGQKAWDELKNQVISAFPEEGKEAKLPDLNIDWEKTLWVDVQDSYFSLYKLGELVQKVKDPLASDGQAARMPGFHPEWATAWSFTPELLNVRKRWHVYAQVRFETKATTGVAMTMGIYDSENKKGVVDKRLSVTDPAGSGYQLIDFGAHDFTPKMYIWFAPPKRDDVDAVYIDRVFLVEED
ncbi:MAG: DUF4838 domain-containing protein [Thermoguttaceae bacterium]|nr:DUF4838 domain-containing protein [Thermoguttaceae bacterium]